MDKRTRLVSAGYDQINIGLVAAAGLDVIAAEERAESEDGVVVTHLWVVAKRL